MGRIDDNLNMVLANYVDMVGIRDNLKRIHPDSYLDAELVARETIKQAFMDEGYEQDMANLHANMKQTAIRLGLSSTPRDERLTGQEWYDRFEKEVNNYPLANTVDLDNHSWRCEDVLKAAKKASGVRDE